MQVLPTWPTRRLVPMSVALDLALTLSLTLDLALALGLAHSWPVANCTT